MADQFSADVASRVDPAGVWKAYESWPDLAKLGSEAKAEVPANVKKVYVLGMGGSAAGGDIAAGWMGERAGAEMQVLKGGVPVSDMKGALAIACSVSGGTYETIEMLKTSVKRGASAVSISSGGRIMEVSKELGVPHIKTPTALAPRYLLPYMIFACVTVAGRAIGIRTEEECADAVSEMRSEGKSIGIGVPAESNPSKALSEMLLSATPAVYGTDVTRGVGVRFKSILNENAKRHAYFEVIPDVFHNEVEAWEDPSEGFLPVFLRHTGESPRDGELTDRMAGMLTRLGKSPVQVRGRGRASLAQLATMAYRLDMAAYYLALGLGRDPYPTKLLDELKK